MTQVLMFVSATICAACALHPLAGVRFTPSPGQRHLTVISSGLRRIGAILPALVMPIAMIEAALVGAVPTAWWVLALVVSSLLLAWQARLASGSTHGAGSTLSTIHRNLLPLACAWLLVSASHGGHLAVLSGGATAPDHHFATPEWWLAALPALLVLASLACFVGQLRTRPRGTHGRMPLAETVSGTFMLGVMTIA